MAKKFDAKAHIVGLNTLRIQIAKTPFTSNTIREGFKSYGIPSNTLFWTVFSNSELIQKMGDGLYCFRNSDKPIHFHMLEDIYKEYKKRVTIYHNKWSDRKKHKDILKRHDIQDAIKLLQNNGFTVAINISNISM